MPDTRYQPDPLDTGQGTAVSVLPTAEVAPEEDSYGDDFASLMQQELLESEAVQGPIRDRVAAHYAAYRLSADLEVLPFQEHVRLPLARAATDDRVARFAGPFVTDRNPIVVTAVEGTDPEAAQANEALLNRQFNDTRLLNGKKVLIRAGKIAEWAGTAYVFCDWVEERRMRFGVGMLGDEDLDLDGPRWRVVHPYDVFPDPRSDDVRTMRYLWIREEVPLREFRERVASGMYPLATPEIQEAVARSAGVMGSSVSGIAQGDRFDLPAATGNPAPNESDSQVAAEGDKPVYLFHRFTREKWCVAAVTGDRLREVPNPAPDGEIPVRNCVPNPDIQGPNGVPAAEASHGMNAHANSIASAYMEAVRRSGVQTMLMAEGEQDNVMHADITGCPGEILVVRDPERAFRPMLKGSDAAQVNLQGIEVMKFWSEYASKSTDYRQGVSAGGAPGTATGTQAFQEQADTQFRIPFALFSDFVNDLVALTALYNQSFLVKAQWVRRIGRRGASVRTYEVSRPMLQGEFEYGTTASEGQGNPQAAQGIGALVNQFGAIPGLLDMPYLAREFAKAVRIPNADRAVPAFVHDPITPEDAIEMVKIGLPVPAHPADDHMEFADAFAAAAWEALQRGEEEEAALLKAAAEERLFLMQSLIGSATRGRDVGNPDGSRASDKGRPVPGGRAGRVVPGPGSAGLDGGSPGPAAPPGRDLPAAVTG